MNIIKNKFLLILCFVLIGNSECKIIWDPVSNYDKYFEQLKWFIPDIEGYLNNFKVWDDSILSFYEIVVKYGYNF